MSRDNRDRRGGHLRGRRRGAYPCGCCFRSDQGRDRQVGAFRRGGRRYQVRVAVLDQLDTADDEE